MNCKGPWALGQMGGAALCRGKSRKALRTGARPVLPGTAGIVAPALLAAPSARRHRTLWLLLQPTNREEAMRARTDEVMWREVEGEAVILDLKTSTYLTTNATGARMWKLLQEETTPAELERHLVGTYGISEDVARQDVDAFLAMLRENDLLCE